MDDASRAVLKAAYEAANSWDERATIAVVVGLVIEFLALLIYSKDMPKGEKRLLIIGSILVAIGCGGEYIFGGRASIAAVRLQQDSDEKIAQLGKDQEDDHKIAQQAAQEAARLGVKVDTLPSFVAQKENEINGQLSDFQKFAAAQQAQDTATIAQLTSAKNDVAKARTDAVAAANAAIQTSAAMQAANAPRAFSPVQQAAIRNAAGRHKGMTLHIFLAGDSSDIRPLAAVFTTLLKDGGNWSVSEWVWSGIGPMQGLELLIEPDANPKAIAAAADLQMAIDGTTKPVQEWPGKWEEFGGMLNGGPFSADAAQIRLVIGSKPQ